MIFGTFSGESSITGTVVVGRVDFVAGALVVGHILWRYFPYLDVFGRHLGRFRAVHQILIEWRLFTK
jgi:hypothetical protein